MTVSVSTERAIQRFIERWQLHDNPRYCLPVPILQAARDEGWTVRYVEGLFPLYGFAAVRGHKRLMGINAEVARPYQRMAIAHELGHVLNGDEAGLHLCNEWEWMYNKQEREASKIAARLLIPDGAFHLYDTIADLAAACDVPQLLVELRLEV